jgi:hypothetical protein
MARKIQSFEQSKQLAKPKQNEDRANYLRHGTKLPQPHFIGLYILAQPNHTIRCDKHVNGNSDGNQAA